MCILETQTLVMGVTAMLWNDVGRASSDYLVRACKLFCQLLKKDLFVAVNFAGLARNRVQGVGSRYCCAVSCKIVKLTALFV